MRLYAYAGVAGVHARKKKTTHTHEGVGGGWTI